eukprot:8614058-Ditylum_brightwellii.AAC.1
MAQVSYGSRIWTNRKWDNINNGRTNLWNRLGCNRHPTKLNTSDKCMPKSICKTQQRMSNTQSSRDNCATGAREGVCG